jgi:hypothetical protein
MKPWQSRQEQLVDLALESAISTPEQIRAIRPVVPQQLMPQIRGFAKSEPDIYTILTTGREGPIPARSWISGAPVMFRNGQMVDTSFSGSSRYSMSSLSGGG